MRHCDKPGSEATQTLALENPLQKLTQGQLFLRGQQSSFVRNILLRKATRRNVLRSFCEASHFCRHGRLLHFHQRVNVAVGGNSKILVPG